MAVKCNRNYRENNPVKIAVDISLHIRYLGVLFLHFQPIFCNMGI